MKRLLLLLRTARHLQASQIASRAARMIRTRWWAWRRTPAPWDPAARRNAAFRSSWPREESRRDLDRARAIAAGRFEFLAVLRDRPSWNQPDVSQLWRFHLHYFDYAEDLVSLAAFGSADAETAFGAFRDLVRSWIRDNGVIEGDGWHPYTVSLRIVNWCEAGAYFAAKIAADPHFETELHASLHGQARFLARNLETDVGGNHLLKNLRGLLWASAYFTGPEARRWRRIVLARLRPAVAEQVLADGGHFERVPAYHVQVLEDLRTSSALLGREGEPQPWLDEAVARMVDFLQSILPPGGRLPLLKDTTLEAQVPPFITAQGRSRYLASSGFAVVRDDRRGDFLIADYGIPCPDSLPAHAHADLFSFELTRGGRPLVVDSGVYEYAAGRWRDWFRSTAAHNTVEVAGADQSEMWGSFRVARRARPSRVSWIEEDDTVIIQGEHDGYRRLSPPVTHRRTIVVQPGLWLIVDELFGRGPTRACSRVHLHPSCAADELRLAAFGGTMRVEPGWYSEQFGEKRENDVMAIDVAGELPLRFGYCIGDAAPPALRITEEDGVPTVMVTGRDAFRLLLPRDAPPRLLAERR